MVPEKAKHLEREDMVALSLLVRLQTAARYMSISVCAQRNMYAIGYSSLSYGVSPWY